jgi:glycosyltransferase involved in cell wall biosynthesis
VDLKRFRPGPKDEVLLRLLHIPEDAFVVTFVGKLASHKGVYVLPYALKILADDGMTKVHVVLAGRGAQRGPLEKLVGLLGLADRFHFLDFLGYHDIHRVHSIADAFVLPSYPTLTWQEQFGFVLVESMASGKAVVASNSGAIGEVVGDAGLLFPAGDFDALAGLLRRLITDRALREDLGGKARARAEALFDPSRNADALYDVYQQVVRA